MIRSPRLATAVAALVGLGLTACTDSWSPDLGPAMFRGDPQHTGVLETQGVDRLGGVLWRFQTDGPVRSSPTVTGEMLFIGSTDGRVYAIDRLTGREQWRADVQSPVSSSPAVAGGLVVFVSRDGICHAVDAWTGQPKWQTAFGSLVPWEWGFEGWDVYLSSPVIEDETVVVGGQDGTIYALDLQTGEQTWRFDTEGRIRSTPAIADGVVFVGGTDGVAYALGISDGQLKWRHETDGISASSEELGVDRKSIIASPAVAGGTVYFGSRDGFMYALDEQTGDRKWQFGHDGSWAMSSPALLGGALFSGTSDGRWVHRVDVTTGEEIWRHFGEGYTWSSPTLVDRTLYIGDGAGFLRAIDSESGKERWSFPTGGGVYSSPSVLDGLVFFGADDGVVYALHGEGAYPRRAVFWDAQFSEYTAFPHVETRFFFEEKGYEVLGAERLEAFLGERILDQTPSVVVFAMDHIPDSVAEEPFESSLLLRYLRAGGKVVWLGIPPMSLARNEAGQITAFDRARATRFLGVDYSESNFDFYGTAPTEVGEEWGLERGWVASYSIAASPEIQVLGVDENGRAGAWVKSYGGPEGTGFVGVGTYTATLDALEAVRILAEFGLADRLR